MCQLCVNAAKAKAEAEAKAEEEAAKKPEYITDYPKATVEFFKPATHPKGLNMGVNDYGNNVQYCMLSSDNKQVSQISTCRAYLIDIMCSKLNPKGQTTNCAGYDDAVASPDLEHTRLGFTLNNNEKAAVEVQMIEDFLHKFEKDLGFEPTQFYESIAVRRKSLRLFVAVGDKRWYSSPIVFSLYLLLFRTLTNNTQPTIYHNLDQDWRVTAEKAPNIRSFLVWLNRFAKYGVTTFFKDDLQFNYNLQPFQETHEFGINLFCGYTVANGYYGLYESQKPILEYAYRFKDDKEIEAYLAKTE